MKYKISNGWKKNNNRSTVYGIIIDIILQNGLLYRTSALKKKKFWNLKAQQYNIYATKLCHKPEARTRDRTNIDRTVSIHKPIQTGFAFLYDTYKG